MLYSQNLEPGDIDIFINNVETISDMLNGGYGNTDNETAEWAAYIEIGTEFVNSLMNLFEGGGQFDAFEVQYERLMNCAIPGELEDLFRSIGWKSNGHKKLWTLSLGGAFWFAKNNILDMFSKNEEVVLQIVDKVLNLFTPHDLDIISQSEKLQEYILMLF
ncbi:MAG: hypothetical protein LBE02_01540 [Spirochaetaceae bacterium]|nr:hypothetical protein [Spirochaetaceae bacterium]